MTSDPIPREPKGAFSERDKAHLKTPSGLVATYWDSTSKKTPSCLLFWQRTIQF